MAGPSLTTVGTFNAAVQRHGAARAIAHKQSGAWHWTTYRQLGELVTSLRGGLASIGVQRGDRVALVSDNRLEWVAVAFAVAGLGASLVPIAQAQSTEEQRFIVRDSGAKVVFCATDELFSRLETLPREVDTLEQRIGLNLSMSHPSSYARLLAVGRDNAAPTAHIAPEDAAVILYTSGTTATPKGVVLSHRGICENVDALTATMPLDRSDVTLSVLPWSMSFGYTCELHLMMRLGGGIAIASSSDKLVSELSQVHPTMLVAVPQVLQHLYDVLSRTVRSKPPVIRGLFDVGRALNRKQIDGRLKLTERLKLEAANRAVLNPLRQRLGGKLRYIFCGGATLSTEVAQFLSDVGLPVYEGYGLTEAGPVVTTNRPGAVRLGSVGKPLRGVTVTIDGEQGGDERHGEIVVASPSLMTRYHGRTEAVGGTLRTRDLGFIDDDGYLHITGRLDDEYKLANGKHVVPSRLERELKLSKYVRAAMVYGEGHEHNVALIVVDVDALSRWAEERKLHFADTSAMLASPRVKRHMMAEVGEQSGTFRGYERVRDVLLVADSLDPDSGMLSPSQALRRTAILEKYGDALAALCEPRVQK